MKKSLLPSLQLWYCNSHFHVKFLICNNVFQISASIPLVFNLEAHISESASPSAKFLKNQTSLNFQVLLIRHARANWSFHMVGFGQHNHRSIGIDISYCCSLCNGHGMCKFSRDFDFFCVRDISNWKRLLVALITLNFELALKLLDWFWLLSGCFHLTESLCITKYPNFPIIIMKKSIFVLGFNMSKK